jgi:hypothetical protein
MMRCLVKNLAMFGLGLYIYAGEDLPEGVEEQPKEVKIVTLEIGDDNWTKVLSYIASKKELGLDKIVENLSTKYEIKPNVKKEIAKAIK